LGSGHKKATSAQTTTTTTTGSTKSSTIPLSEQKRFQTTPQFALAESPTISGQEPITLPGTSDDQLRIRLATSGWPAVAKLPYTSNGVKVDLDGNKGGVVVLSVKYSGSASQARAAVKAFLRHNYDSPDHYSLRLTSSTQNAHENKVAEIVGLGMKGYRAVPYLPFSHGTTMLRFVGEQGSQVILEARYSGTKAQAVHDATTILKMLKDRPSHYSIRYRRR
jgi:hypothetical protein